jgi:hypothetical protein
LSKIETSPIFRILPVRQAGKSRILPYKVLAKVVAFQTAAPRIYLLNYLSKIETSPISRGWVGCCGTIIGSNEYLPSILGPKSQKRKKIALKIAQKNIF